MSDTIRSEQEAIKKLTATESLYETDLDNVSLIKQGKVRDIYAIDNERLLIVTTDRMSAFDVVLQDCIPYKGWVLNKLTSSWMKDLRPLIDSALITDDITKFPNELLQYKDILQNRSMIVKRTAPIPLECIVRGYITGSAWNSYRKNGTVNGEMLRAGYQHGDKLDEPIFTPSIKESSGHDLNISFERACEIVGDRTLVEQIKKLSIEIYNKGVERAKKCGMLIVDTKLEFGLLNGNIVLIDEVLTPDSSRFWKEEAYNKRKENEIPPSYDKQYLRDYLKSTGWDMEPPAPKLPEDVIVATMTRYLNCLDMYNFDCYPIVIT